MGISSGNDEQFAMENHHFHRSIISLIYKWTIVHSNLLNVHSLWKELWKHPDCSKAAARQAVRNWEQNLVYDRNLGAIFRMYQAGS